MKTLKNMMYNFYSKKYALKIYEFKTSNHKYDYKIRDFAD